MFLCYVLAAYYFVRWIDDESWKHYGLAMTATALALLAKASAAHIGLFFGILLITKIGLKALRQPRIWLFGAGALLPSIVWYKHAHNLWLTYGNSLGVSNETHWAGMDLFTNPTFILGIERAELFYVWMPTGVVLGLLALVMRSPTKAVRYSLYWLVAIEAFYLLAARTTSDSWATYYHVVSIPAVALMIGAGVDTVIQLRYQRSLLLALSIASIGLIVLLVITDLLSLSSFDMRLLFKLGALLGLSALMLIALFVGRTERESPSTSRFVRLNTAVIYFAIVCLAATSLYQIRMIRDDFQARAAEGSLFACSHQFAPAIPADVLIAASGGACVDPTGFPVAFNSSYMFYWLDRKGFSICIEKQSIAALKLLADRGARYFVAEKSAVKMKPGFDVELQMSFPLIMECKDAYLFQIQPPPSGTRTGNK
jgi:hypothetical protein